MWEVKDFGSSNIHYIWENWDLFLFLGLSDVSFSFRNPLMKNQWNNFRKFSSMYLLKCFWFFDPLIWLLRSWTNNLEYIYVHVCVCVCVCMLCCAMLSCSVMSNSLWPHGCSPPGSSVHGNSPGKNTGVSCHALLWGIFPTQRLNPGLPHCKQILYCLSHQGSPRILEWVAYPFSRASS